MTRAQFTGLVSDPKVIITLLGALVLALGWQTISPAQRIARLDARVDTLAMKVDAVDGLALDRCLEPGVHPLVQAKLNCASRVREIIR